MKKRFLSLILAIVMVMSFMPSFAEEDFITRDNLANLLITSADDYTPNLTMGDIIKGYGYEDLKYDTPATRAEFYVMLCRAFPDLPKPSGNNLYLSEQHLSFTKVPDWSIDAVQKLIKAGVLTSTSDGTLMADQLITKTEAENLIRRIFQLYALNLKDDFYSTVNKAELESAGTQDNGALTNAFTSLEAENTKKLKKILDDIISSPNLVGSHEQKIADYYNSILDKKSRDKAGILPIKKYLDAINSATTLRQLAEAESLIAKELFPCGLMNFTTVVNLKNNNYNILCLDTVSPHLSKAQYTADSNIQDAYIEYLKELLTLSGELPETALFNATEYYIFEKELASAMLMPQESNNPDKTFNIYTLKELSDVLPNANLKSIILDCGYSTPTEVLVTDTGLLKVFARHYNNKNLSLLKTGVKLSLLFNFGTYLSTDFSDAQFKFEQAQTGAQSRKSDTEIAIANTCDVMGEYLGEIFAHEHSSAKIKTDVTKLVRNLIRVYKERILNLDWMSTASKEMAVKKLDNMKLKIAYPDSWRTPLDNVNILPPSDGENVYFKNYIAIARSEHENKTKQQSQKTDKERWLCNVYDVNAYYNLSANEITIPAGILAPPFYDADASAEQNLGGLGTIIAHEITHAFDNNGAKFDHMGNSASWWSGRDVDSFNALCEQVAEQYDGYEVAPGIENDGHLTLSENISDLGGVACALDAVKKLENPSYDEFFSSYAKIWCITSTRQYQQLMSQTDVHSAAKIRVNRTLISFDEFYDTYDIKTGDGMYLPPEMRIKVW